MAVLTEEQNLLRDAAKSFATERAPTTALRALRDGDGWKTGYSPRLYKDMAEMGWTGVIIPEAYGGSEFGLFGLGLVLEELGRTLAASPLHSTALAAASALILAGDAGQKSTWLPKIASGEITATLAVDETAHHDPAQVALKATAQGDGFVLHGKKRFIPDAANADLIVVLARTAGWVGDETGLTLVLVEKGAAGLRLTPLQAIDTRGFADLVFDGVKIERDAVLGAPGEAFPVLMQVLDRARVGLAAEMLGAASRAFDITLDYLKTRTQFGQLIGSFQALQHRAAKMFTALELTRSCVEAALNALDQGAADASQLATLAKAKANETAHLISSEMVQMHGGIGMTDAHDAGLYMKRARVTEALYGGASYLRDRYARLGGY